jgi:hypothetical protein
MNHLPEPYPPNYESPVWGPTKDPREDLYPDEVDAPGRRQTFPKRRAECQNMTR